MSWFLCDISSLQRSELDLDGAIGHVRSQSWIESLPPEAAMKTEVMRELLRYFRLKEYPKGAVIESVSLPIKSCISVSCDLYRFYPGWFSDRQLLRHPWRNPRSTKWKRKPGSIPITCRGLCWYRVFEVKHLDQRLESREVWLFWWRAESDSLAVMELQFFVWIDTIMRW